MLCELLHSTRRFHHGLFLTLLGWRTSFYNPSDNGLLYNNFIKFAKTLDIQQVAHISRTKLNNMIYTRMSTALRSQMDIIDYKGQRFKITQRYKWVDESFVIVSDALQEILSKEYSSKIFRAAIETQSFQTQWNLFDDKPANPPDLSKLYICDIVMIADRCREISSFYRSLLCFEYIVAHADMKTVAGVFPRMTSCYRKLGLPKRAISLATHARKRLGNEVLTASLLTSVGAAYCDLEQCDKARICFNQALELSNHTPSKELSLAIERLQKKF